MIFSLTACLSPSNQNQDQFPNISTVTLKNTPIAKNTKTPIPIIATITSTPRSTAEATLQTLGEVCEPPASVDSWGEISPYGDWIAVVCEGKNEVVGSYLRVINVENKKGWNIHYVDYSKYGFFDRRNKFFPFHWSKDGKYLFANSPTIGSGCCWIGYDVILVRLNLENGEQTEIANYEGILPGGLSFSISQNDRYVLYTPSDSLKILDLDTQKEKTIILGIGNNSDSAGYPLMSPDNKKVILVFREYPKEQQGDLTFGSLVLVDLSSGSQKRLLSGMDYDNTPIPVSWKDSDYVLLQSSDGKFWLLNINTIELTETKKP